MPRAALRSRGSPARASWARGATPRRRRPRPQGRRLRQPTQCARHRVRPVNVFLSLHIPIPMLGISTSRCQS
eukprot:3455794-Pyramimonas_sp.AAC.1